MWIGVSPDMDGIDGMRRFECAQAPCNICDVFAALRVIANCRCRYFIHFHQGPRQCPQVWSTMQHVITIILCITTNFCDMNAHERLRLLVVRLCTLKPVRCAKVPKFFVLYRRTLNRATSVCSRQAYSHQAIVTSSPLIFEQSQDGRFDSTWKPSDSAILLHRYMFPLALIRAGWQTSLVRGLCGDPPPRDAKAMSEMCAHTQMLASNISLPYE